jgi:hypothetical protein
LDLLLLEMRVTSDANDKSDETNGGNAHASDEIIQKYREEDADETRRKREPETGIGLRIGSGFGRGAISFHG